MNEKNDKLKKIFANRFGSHLNFSNEDYAHAFGRESDLLLYSVVFFPALVEIEQSIFFKKNVISEFDLKKNISETKNDKDIEELESNFNFIEVGYLFDCNGRDLPEEEELLLANIIRESWDSWLHFKYPKRKFNVEILDRQHTGSSLGVQFYEVRHH